MDKISMDKYDHKEKLLGLSIRASTMGALLSSHQGKVGSSMGSALFFFQKKLKLFKLFDVALWGPHKTLTRPLTRDPTVGDALSS